MENLTKVLVNDRLDIEELNKMPSYKIVEFVKMVGLSVKVFVKLCLVSA